MNANAPSVSTPDLQKALEALRPQQLPDAIAWWPPAPGWWILAVLILLISILLFRGWSRRQARLRLPKLALAELESLTSLDDITYAHASQNLLRRLAINLPAPNPDSGPNLGPDQAKSSAALQGKAWLSWLDSRSTPLASQPNFNSELGQQWQHLIYAAPSSTESFDRSRLHKLIQHWIHQQMRQRKNKGGAS